MNEQIIYKQPIYAQTKIQYQNSEEPRMVKGLVFEPYVSTNYQQNINDTTSLPPIIYKTQFEQQPQNQEFLGKINYLEQSNLEQSYELSKNDSNIRSYQQPIQLSKQNIIQHQKMIYSQQPVQTIVQQPKITPQQMKIVQQISQKKNNFQHPIPFNPYYMQQYPQQNIPPSVNQSKINQNIQIKENLSQDKPLIESEFQPEFQMANSIISQSQIKVELTQSNLNSKQSQIKQSPNQSKIIQQIQQSHQKTFPHNYVVPLRNPNININRYEQIDNDSHFVISEDPGLRSLRTNNTKTTRQNPNISKEISISESKFSQFAYKDSNLSKKSIEANFEDSQLEKENEDLHPEVGFGSSVISQSVMSKVNKMGNSNVQNSDSNINNNVSNCKISDEIIEKENPIEEKRPDEINLNDLENESIISNLQKKNQNPLNISITDRMDKLPTISNIMKGTNEILPPPTKKKYI